MTPSIKEKNNNNNKKKIHFVNKGCSICSKNTARVYDNSPRMFIAQGAIV